MLSQKGRFAKLSHPTDSKTQRFVIRTHACAGLQKEAKKAFPPSRSFNALAL